MAEVGDLIRVISAADSKSGANTEGKIAKVVHCVSDGGIYCVAFENVNRQTTDSNTISTFSRTHENLYVNFRTFYIPNYGSFEVISSATHYKTMLRFLE